MLNDIDDNLTARLAQFSEDLQKSLDLLIGDKLEAYGEKHFGGEMPVHEMFTLLTIVAALTSAVTLRNLVLDATFQKDDSVGLQHIELMKQSFQESFENIDYYDKKLTEILNETTTVRTVN